VAPEVIERVESTLADLVPPRSKTEARSLSLAGERVLHRLPATLDGLTSAKAVACVRTAAFIGGQEALKLLTRYASNPHHDVQWELATVWQYFPAEQYAVEVLGDAPLRNGAIEVRQIEHVRHVHRLRNLRKTFVDVVEDRDIDSLEFLNGVPHLHYLRARAKARATVSLSPLAGHKELTGVKLYHGGGYATDLSVLAELPSLRDLTLVLPPGTGDAGFVLPLRALDTLHLLNCHNIEDLSALGHLGSLRELFLERCSELPQLPRLAALTTFRLDGTTRLSTPDIAGSLPVLTSLRLDSCLSIEDLTPFMAPGLTDITITSCPVTDLTPLARLTRLERLKLTRTKVASLRPLATVRSLREIDISQIQSELDLPMFPDHPQPLTIKVRMPFRLPGKLDAPDLGPNVKVELL
jgi:hypothetical protein